MKIIFAAIGVLLAVGFGGVGSRAWAVDESPTFDAERLGKVHDRLLADYPAKLRTNTFTPTYFYLQLATALEDVGVRVLLDDHKAGLVPPATRIAILNDYGFWLSKTSDPRKAVAVLQKVIELAPTRAVAELNLGDAARLALTVAETWEQKNNFTAVSLRAYAGYQKLAGKEAPAARAFRELRAAASSSKDVCSYVAAFYDRGRQDDMWGYPDPVDIAGDGKLRHVYIFNQGTAHIPVIFASTKPVAEEDRLVESFNEPPEVDFDSTRDQSTAEEYGSWPEFHILPFKDGYYLVDQQDGGPVVVVKPNAGTVCRFKRSFAPLLVEDQAPEICKDALAGRTFHKVWDAPLPDEDIQANDVDLNIPAPVSPNFRRYSDVKLDPKGAPSRVGYYEYSWGGGSGCDSNGVAFLNGQSLEKSARAKALSRAQSEMTDCRGSSTFLIEANGENLIEWNGGRALQRTRPPRTLLRLRDDKLETVCRVEQRPTYIPEPVVKPH